MKNILFWLLVVLGETIIITGFLMLGLGLPGDVLVLDIVVTSLLLGLTVYSFATPAIRLGDPSGKQGAGLGISWLGSTLYTIAVVIAMVAGIVYSIHFKYQLLIQAVLLFLFLIAVLSSVTATAKAGKVYVAERAKSLGIDEMREAVNMTADKARLSGGVPAEVTARLDRIAEILRFTSPSSSPKAARLEREFVDVMGDIRRALPDYSLNSQAITDGLDRAALIACNRSRTTGS